MEDQISKYIPATAPIQSVILLMLSLYFGYQLYKMVRGMHILVAFQVLLCIYFGYLLGTWKGVPANSNFLDRLFAATIGAVIQVGLMLIDAVLGTKLQR